MCITKTAAEHGQWNGCISSAGICFFVLLPTSWVSMSQNWILWTPQGNGTPCAAVCHWGPGDAIPRAQWQAQWASWKHRAPAAGVTLPLRGWHHDNFMPLMTSLLIYLTVFKSRLWMATHSESGTQPKQSGKKKKELNQLSLYNI